jgi:hypothetical protein
VGRVGIEDSSDEALLFLALGFHRVDKPHSLLMAVDEIWSDWRQCGVLLAVRHGHGRTSVRLSPVDWRFA